MMRGHLSFVIALSLSLSFSLAAHVASAKDAPEAATVGKAAPDFELTDTDGKTVKLSALRGKIVVLEWFNHECPFVKYAHGDGGPLDGMAARWDKKGVVWLAINSNAPGKQGNGKDKNAAARKTWKLAHPVLLDENGAVGKLYGAKTTPHMFIVDAKGNLAYAGGLDNAPRGEPESDKLVPYVDLALGQLAAGQPVDTKETRAYGCSVKYAD